MLRSMFVLYISQFGNGIFWQLGILLANGHIGTTMKVICQQI